MAQINFTMEGTKWEEEIFWHESYFCHLLHLHHITYMVLEITRIALSVLLQLLLIIFAFCLCARANDDKYV